MIKMKFAILILSLLASCAYSQGGQKGGDDKSSDNQKQEKIQKFKDMPEEQKQKMRELFTLFKSLSPDEKELLRKNLKKYEAMPPEKRARMRELFKKLGQKTEGEDVKPLVRREFIQWLKDRLDKDKINQLRNLSPDEKKALRHKLFSEFKEDFLRRAIKKGEIPQETIDKMKDMLPEERKQKLQEIFGKLMQKRKESVQKSEEKSQKGGKSTTPPSEF